jgi:hypothetical protein
MIDVPNEPLPRALLTNRLSLVGVVLVVVSVAIAGLAFSEGDIVTALGMGLMVAAGVLFAGIGLSPSAS